VLLQVRGGIDTQEATRFVSDLSGTGQRVVSDLSQDVDGLSRTWTDAGGRKRRVVEVRAAKGQVPYVVHVDWGTLLASLLGVVVGGGVTYLAGMQLARADAARRRGEALQHRLLDTANAYLGAVAEYRRHAADTLDWIDNWRASREAGHADAAAISWDRRVESIARREEERARALVERVRLELLAPDLAVLAGALLSPPAPVSDPARQEAAEARWQAANDAFLSLLRVRLSLSNE
jgi:hypothetical protein